MRLVRCIPAIMLALVLAIGGTGYVPMPQASDVGMADSGKAVAPDQAMPDCPMCVPDDTFAPGCAPGCPASAAVLPLAVVVTAGPLARRQSGTPVHRLADIAGAPEPPPPKPSLLS